MADTPEEFDDLFEPVATEPPATEQVPSVPCPSCGTMNLATSRHCVSCGARVAQGPLPMAPQPLARSTAGSRALIVTAAVIAVVAIIAFFYNAFVDDENPTDTTAANGGTNATTSSSVDTGGPATETVLLTPNRVVPSAQLSGFPADNLIDSDPLTMWQVGQEGVGATLTFFFPEPVALERIELKNISEENQFRQNFRVRGLRISPDDTTRPTVVELANTRDVQPVAIQTEMTKTVRIEVTSTYPAEAVGDNQPFKELAIEDIQFFGSIATP